MDPFFLKFKIIKEALLACFVVSMTIVSCDKKVSMQPADKAALKVSVDIARTLIDSTVEGTEAGEYELGSKDSLTPVLTASEKILNENSATQVEVDNATVQINASVAVYRTHCIRKVPPKAGWVI